MLMLISSTPGAAESVPFILTLAAIGIARSIFARTAPSPAIWLPICPKFNLTIYNRTHPERPPVFGTRLETQNGILADLIDDLVSAFARHAEIGIFKRSIRLNISNKTV
ncbi:Uncharacterised protein [Neisseria gonorrhoeae]|uniref:Uncharacterized protein n=1 Tax=Neisseria gonorrhoeae TaxID=485 RepID=A0A378W0P6_NEIGO|nr:Uncharacterised protein [Neisseria gonorrhoeae]